MSLIGTGILLGIGLFLAPIVISASVMILGVVLAGIMTLIEKVTK